jgi:LacI family transcriptional regulator
MTRSHPARADEASNAPDARPTLADVAASAGVSLATADRVLHNRRGVRPATRQRVVQAAEALHYLSEDSLATVAQAKPSRMVFVLPSGRNRFIDLIGEYAERIEEHLGPFNVEARVHWVKGFDPGDLAVELEALAGRADAVAFVPLEHPAVREAANKLVASGTAVLTLASDLSNSNRTAYVGLDNYATGRTAALLMGRWIGRASGSVIMIRGSLSYRGHGERELGFRHLLQEAFPGLDISGMGDGQDDPEQTYQLVKRLLAQQRDLVGLYNIGGGSAGVGRALKEAGLAGQVVVITHELTPETRGFLLDETMAVVIHQNVQLEVMNCVRIVANVRDGKRPQEGIEPVRIGIIVRENLP